MINKDINDYIDAHFDEMVEKLKALIEIDSKTSDKKGDMPFGENVQRALLYAEDLLNGYGFKTTNYDNYVLTADINDKKYGLDILAHLDVVVEGEGWTVCEPFKPVIRDNKIYGRGTADDKGPAIAAIFAMRAVKELGYELKEGVRLILGTDEECGSSDLDYYYSKEKAAKMSFTPDAEFPVVNTEKGRLSSEFTGKFKTGNDGINVLSIHSGSKSNVVPGKAYAVLSGVSVKELETTVNGLIDDNNIKLSVTKDNDNVRLHIDGRGGHAAFPENSNNALTALITILSKIDLSDSEANNLIKNLAKLFPYGDYYGKNIGVAMKDEISGALTLSFNMLTFENGDFSGVFDCRAALCANDENLTNVIRKNLANIGLDMKEEKMDPPHHVPADSFFVSTLLEVYEDYFNKKGVPHSTGGGTYVHYVDNGVAFGCEVEGVDNHMHGADEFMDLAVLKMSAKMFADAIIRLCA